MFGLLFVAVAAAATLTSPDGVFTLDAPGYQAVSPTEVARGREAFTVEVIGAKNPGDLGVLDFLRGFAAQNDAGVQVFTWQGESEGRPAGCLDTRTTGEEMKVEVHTWCGTLLPDGRVAVIRMNSRDVVRGRKFGKAAQRLLDGVEPAAVVAPVDPVVPPPIATEELPPPAPTESGAP